MGRSTGFIGLVIVVAVGGYFYTSQLKQVAANVDAPAAAINVTGVRNDLLAMAQSELRYLASHPTYASLDQLKTDGDIHVPTRPDFVYDIDAGTDHFTITATYIGTDPKATRHLRIDDTKTITQD
jgi:Tfp pilus assembly protein PilW